MSRLTGLEQYVLRYWETEFPQIKPDKGRSGQRRYTKKDLDAVLQIKQLLYKDGYTIAGARKKLNGRGEQENISAVLESAKKELREILEMLK
jgi:DNA-binding transcriptional MerR regulator